MVKLSCFFFFFFMATLVAVHCRSPLPPLAAKAPVPAHAPAPAHAPVPAPAHAPVPAPRLTPAPAPALPPAADCETVLLDMSDCLTFVEVGSTDLKPSAECCVGFKKVVNESVACLCGALKNSSSLPIALNVTKAMTLSSACGLSSNPCGSVIPGPSPPHAVPGPSPSPLPAPGPAPALSPSSRAAPPLSPGISGAAPSPSSEKSGSSHLSISGATSLLTLALAAFYF